MVYKTGVENGFDFDFAATVEPKFEGDDRRLISIFNMNTWVNVETFKWDGSRKDNCLQCGEEKSLECMCCEPVL